MPSAQKKPLGLKAPDTVRPMMGLGQITGGLLDAGIRVIRAFGTAFLAMAAVLLLLPTVALAIGLSPIVLIAAVVIFGCFTVFAPPPWLSRSARLGRSWLGGWLLYLRLNDRQKILMGPLAHGARQFWFRTSDEDMQRLVDAGILNLQFGTSSFSLLSLSHHGDEFVRRFRRRIRSRWQNPQSDELVKSTNAILKDAQEQSQRRI